MMIMTRLIPPTAPATVPTVCINATGSFDFDATVIMKKKNTSAITIRTRPTMKIRQFLRRIAASSDLEQELLGDPTSELKGETQCFFILHNSSFILRPCIAVVLRSNSDISGFGGRLVAAGLPRK